jgi:hypothetical protein
VTALDFDHLRELTKWMHKHPEFDEKPASLKEFLGPHYLNIEGRVRKSILHELEEIIGPEVNHERLTRYPLAMITGGIGIGKTTVASIVLPYLAHWVLCLKDPQGFFNMLPGSRIAFMQMSTSGTQAKEVVFGDIKARIEHSPWFQTNYPFSKDFRNQLRFPKDIWILPGDSAETTFEGYNILGGILDEADSHKLTQDKDYAEQGYTTIHTRVASRFGDKGFLLIIGQMKSATGFAARKYEEFKKDPKAYVVRMSIWESLGWDKFLKPDGSRDSFWYDSKRKEIVPVGVVEAVGGDHLIEIPTTYRRDFDNNPEKALRDLAGIPPASGDPFISLVYKIEDARDRWKQRFQVSSPVDPRGQIAKWLRAQDALKRAAHIDMAFSGQGDALALSMGHVSGQVETEDGEKKPYIIIDLIYRVQAPAGQEIFLQDIRRLIYDLREERKFRLVKVTMDGFQSTDTRQQLQRRRIFSEIVSVDKNLAPYYDLREAIYEDRIEFPEYMVKLRREDSHLTEVAIKELMELVDNGIKIDHPPDGSKDVADSLAGVVFTLMGDRSYHRRVARLDELNTFDNNEESPQNASPVLAGLSGMKAPLPPGMPSSWTPPIRRR